MNSQEEHTTFDAAASLKTMQEMIQVAQKNLNYNGFLFILWGWIFFITLFVLNYLPTNLVTTVPFMKVIRSIRIILPILGIIGTLIYLFRRTKSVTTYIDISMRYIWIGALVSLTAVNLIEARVLGEINFQLQHPIFMIIIAFATVITGSLMRYKLLIIGGIVFGILAWVSSYFPMSEQLLIESLAWLIAFILPGHVLFARRNKKAHV